MAMHHKPVAGFFSLLKQRAGSIALVAFLLETSILSWAIKRKMTLQEIENRDRISIGLANYSLK